MVDIGGSQSHSKLRSRWNQTSVNTKKSRSSVGWGEGNEPQQKRETNLNKNNERYFIENVDVEMPPRLTVSEF